MEEQSSRSIFRFTLREILMATVTIAALIALIQQSWPSTPIGLPDKFSTKRLAEQACKEQSLRFVAVGSSASGSSDQSNFSKQTSVTIESPGFQDSNKIMESALAEISRQIENAGGTLNGVGQTRSRQDLTGFEVSYQRGKTHGHVFVRCELETTPSYRKDANGQPIQLWRVWSYAMEHSN